MRYLYVLLFFMLPAAAFAQTQADYEHAMSKFMQFYNNDQLDSLLSLCSPKLAADSQSIKFTAAWLTTSHNNFGEMTEYKYVNKQANGVDSSVVCKVTFTRYFNGMAMNLDKNNHFECLWFLQSPKMKIKSDRDRPKPAPIPVPQAPPGK